MDKVDLLGKAAFKIIIGLIGLCCGVALLLIFLPYLRYLFANGENVNFEREGVVESVIEWEFQGSLEDQLRSSLSFYVLVGSDDGNFVVELEDHLSGHLGFYHLSDEEIAEYYPEIGQEVEVSGLSGYWEMPNDVVAYWGLGDDVEFVIEKAAPRWKIVLPLSLLGLILSVLFGIQFVQGCILAKKHVL